MLIYAIVPCNVLKDITFYNPMYHSERGCFFIVTVLENHVSFNNDALVRPLEVL
jgi:hypothetical protein